MHSLYSGIRQPSFSSGSTKLSERRPRKTAKTRYEDIYPELSYAKAVELSGFLTLYDRRETISAKLFHEMCANQSHRLHKLLPNEYQPSYSLREQRTFIRSKCKTERSKSSFLLSYVYNSWELDIIFFLIVYRNLTHAFEFVILKQFLNRKLCWIIYLLLVVVLSIYLYKTKSRRPKTEPYGTQTQMSRLEDNSIQNWSL